MRSFCYMFNSSYKELTTIYLLLYSCWVHFVVPHIRCGCFSTDLYVLKWCTTSFNISKHLGGRRAFSRVGDNFNKRKLAGEGKQYVNWISYYFNFNLQYKFNFYIRSNNNINNLKKMLKKMRKSNLIMLVLKHG